MVRGLSSQGLIQQQQRSGLSLLIVEKGVNKSGVVVLSACRD
jgi:hypothetical protein